MKLAKTARLFLPVALASLACTGAMLTQDAAGQGRRYFAPHSVLFDCPDPAVIQPDERGPVYVFATGYGIPFYKSDDLCHWDRVDRVFAEGTPAWARAAIPGGRGEWAPDIRFFNGRYYLYYAVSTMGSQHSVIGLATNKSLDPAARDYRWEDQGLVLESKPGGTDFNAIDPAMIVDHDKQPYLFWGSYWTGLKAARLDPQTGKLPAPDKAEKAEKIVPVAARAPGVDPPAIEAPYVMEHNGYWYLFVSWDSCCDGENSTYKVLVGRSKSILGPYFDHRGRAMAEGGGTLVLASYGKWRGPGHNSALSTPHGDWMVNAGFNSEHLEQRRVLQIRPMYWLDDGWPVVGDVIDGPQEKGRQVNAKPDLAGDWTQWTDYAAPTTLTFRGNGSVSSGSRTGTWRLRDSTLEITWSDAAGSGNKSSTTSLKANGNSFVGRDASGQVLFALKK
jgi:arabinan endo-1,5-alpha-L-arabinosidase